MATFRIAKKAKLDLRSIWNYIYSKGSDGQADKYVAELMMEFAVIVKFPERRIHDKQISNEFLM